MRDSPQEPTTASARAASATAGRIRILIADDCNDMRALLKILVKGLRLDVEEASNGREALERFKTGDFDLVLMDGHMPELDGLEAARRMRAWEQAEQRAPVPIIAVSNDPEIDRSGAWRDAGMSAFLDKPLTQRLLRATVRQWLGDETV